MEEFIKEHYPKLSQKLRDYIESPELDDSIDEIIKDLPLQQVQKDAFGMEVVLVLVQLESIENFTVNIKHNMEIAIKRAEEISKRTKQLIFIPMQDYLIQRNIDSGEKNNKEGSGDIVKREIHQQNVPRQNSKFENRTMNPPIPHQTPHASEKVLQQPKNNDDSLDIFKKRLEEPIHTPVEEKALSESDKQVSNTNPSTKEEIASDPYKESID